MYIWSHICTYLCIIYIYIYTYREREGEREVYIYIYTYIYIYIYIYILSAPRADAAPLGRAERPPGGVRLSMRTLI